MWCAAFVRIGRSHVDPRVPGRSVHQSALLHPWQCYGHVHGRKSALSQVQYLLR